MKRKRSGIRGLITALVVFLAADLAVLYLTGMPRLENASKQKDWVGLDLVSKYQENAEMVGWLQVEGTNINYPVMRGDFYLYRNFSREHDPSGSLFVGEDWEDDDICAIIYGHNMWMFGTMFNPLHQFTDGNFFRKNRTIKFYVLTKNGTSAEKRTFEIQYVIRTSVDRWNYASCQYICDAEELERFMDDCRTRAILIRDSEDAYQEALVLSTCSYHIQGSSGRLLVVGSLTGREEQRNIDVQKN